MRKNKQIYYLDIVIQYIGMRHHITGGYPYIDERRKVRGLRMRNMAQWIKRNCGRAHRAIYRAAWHNKRCLV